MKISYFDDTGTLFIEFREADGVGTQDLDENTVLDVDQNAQVVSITIEHASQRTDVGELVLSGIGVQSAP
jgi:uncharacterized protein YuzE|tara:strand:- start:1585 stop:1794 length:210 start_codon:yes stop_codon:yes gene_type:complete